ncbi:MAG TPA: SMC family ATPase [Actinomycetota bacterium]|nr:SMC family ATPase [Actinomycetota bacterium]
MRPLELTLDGFRSYRSEASFDFEGRGLFGIVGPTGAGKSSILDALIYALYGRTPRIGRETKQLIHSGADLARVRLRFEVDGVGWDVLRVLRRAGSSQVTLRRMDDGSLEREKERDVNDRIVEIVGLDYEAFCSSVTLPQGKFDKFLTATPAERSRILKGIFRYERVDAMREAAKARIGDIAVDLKAAQSELDGLAPDLEGSIATLAAQREAVDARCTALSAAADEFAAAEALAAGVARQLQEVAAEVWRIEQALASVPADGALEALAEEEERGAARVTAAADWEEHAQAETARLTSELVGLEAELAGPGLQQARNRWARHQQLRSGDAARRAAVAQRAAAAEAAQRELASRVAARAAAEQAAAQASAAVRAAHQAHAAHVLREGLHPGDPCPVCAQAVGTLPAVAAPPTLAAAESADRKAAAALRGAAEAASDAQSGAGVAEERRAAAEAELAAAEREVAGLVADLAAFLGGGIDPGAEIARREQVVAAAREAASAAFQAADRARREADSARRALDGVLLRRRSAAASLIGVAARLGLEPPSPEDEASVLLGVAKRARDAGAEALGAQSTRRTDVVREEEASRAALAGLRTRLGLAPGQRLDEALQEAARQQGALAHRIDSLRADIEKRDMLQAKVAAAQERRAIYQQLWSDLSDTKFIAYLLDTHRQALARVGSEKLFQLTNRYRFDDEGQFQLLDSAQNDEPRTADTLSGGETFLASLALALALADAVSQGGSRLECFFLDEGFGSLDIASLDLALDGIESLAEPGRLVGVISHVGGVQARLDDLIVLDKAEDGSTVVVQSEGPIAYHAATI